MRQKEEQIIEQVIRLTETGELTPAELIEACKAVELRQISVSLREIADNGITIYSE